MKRERESKKKKTDLIKSSDNKIQGEWRRAIEMSFYSFITNSPLKKIASFIGTDYYVNFAPALVTETLRMSSSGYGVYHSLTAITETMKDACNEAAHIILNESASREKIPKTPISISLIYEVLDMPVVTLDQIIANDELVDVTPLQTRHILTNDRNRDWLQQYKDAQKTKINVFTVRVGPGNTKASSTTGRYIVSVLMPLIAPIYRLVPPHEPHSTPYEDLEAKYRFQMIELTSHKRMAEQGSHAKGKVSTPYEEALILARQHQSRELDRLRNLSNDQSTQLTVITRQNAELVAIVNSPTFKDTRSIQETALIVTKKLKESRRRNVTLLRIINASGKQGDILEANLKQRKGEEDDDASIVYKKRKTLNGYIKSPITSSSYNSDDEEGYDDDDSQYDSNDDEEDDDSQ